jgi:hypothetical protein
MGRPAIEAAAIDVCVYRDYVIQAVQQCDLFDLLNPRPLLHLLYILIQLLVIALFEPVRAPYLPTACQ